MATPGTGAGGGRFPHIAVAFNAAGYAALAFDFAGCGESEDDSLRADKLVHDIHDAIAQVATLGYRRYALWGHSLGARLCLMARPAGVATMVLSGAGTAPVHYHWPDYYSAEALAELAQHGRMTVAGADPGVRATAVIEAQMLRDFADFEQAALLRDQPCPVLIINGNHPEDAEECALLAGNRQGLHLLPQGSQLMVLEGARHSFADHLNEAAPSERRSRQMLPYAFAALMQADCGGATSFYPQLDGFMVAAITGCQNLREGMYLKAVEGQAMSDAAQSLPLLTGCRERGSVSLQDKEGKTVTLSCKQPFSAPKQFYAVDMERLLARLR